MTNWQPIEYDDIREGEVYRTTYLSERAAKGEFGEVGSRAVYEVDIDARPSSEPEIPVGTTGTATVRGVEGVRVMRVKADHMSEPWWVTADNRACDDWEVTNFIPDETLTDERVEQIRAEERMRIRDRFQVKFGSELWDDIQAYMRVSDWLRDDAR